MYCDLGQELVVPNERSGVPFFGKRWPLAATAENAADDASERAAAAVLPGRRLQEGALRHVFKGQRELIRFHGLV
jgi:hypothetical protein